MAGKIKDILIIEDNQKLAERYKNRLESEGYQVIVLESREKLRQWLAASTVIPQLALVDDNLTPNDESGADGKYAATLLRANFTEILIFAIATAPLMPWSDNKFTFKKIGIDTLLQQIQAAEDTLK